MVWDEDLRVLGRQGAALLLACLAVLEHDVQRAPPVDVGSGVERVVQDFADEAHRRQPPREYEAPAEGLVDG